MENKNQLQPNTTQVPNMVFDEWMPQLKDTELRVLLIVIRQTLGWLEEGDGTGKRKTQDWISIYQLHKKTGKSERSITRALQTLVDDIGIVQTVSEEGKLLDTPDKRSGVGKKIFFRLNLRKPQPGLFPTPAEMSGVKRQKRNQTRPRNRAKVNTPDKMYPRQNGGVQKKPILQKEILAKAGKPDYKEKTGKSQGEVPRETRSINPTTPDKKPVLPTTRLIACFKRYTEEIRHTTPTFERGKDGNLIKAALKHLQADQIELLFLYHLTERSQMSNTIGAALCKESIQGFINAARNEQGFYLRMSEQWKQYNKTKSPDPYGTAAKLALLKQQLATKLAH